MRQLQQRGDEHLVAKLKRAEIEKLLGHLQESAFSALLATCAKLNDYGVASAPEADQGGDTTDQLGVAVVFEDSDSDDDEGMSEVGEVDDLSQDEHENDGEHEREMGVIEAGVASSALGANDDAPIDVRTMDAHWLQREMSAFFSDANESRDVAARVLKILAEEDRGACENQLVLALGFDRFDFIKKLLRNRERIRYVVLYRRAQDEGEKQSVVKELEKRGTDESKAILDALLRPASIPQASTEKVSALQLPVIKQQLQTNASKGRNKRRFIEFGALGFSKGGHHMGNRKCKLPKGYWREGKGTRKYTSHLLRRRKRCPKRSRSCQLGIFLPGHSQPSMVCLP